jgi:hypothetical protein
MLILGETFIGARLGKRAGSFIALAPGTPHFVSVDEERVVQLNNIGPWVITYIDPKDDPRQKPK